MSQYGDGDYATTLQDCTRTARKEHRCCACREPIRRGDRYNYVALLFDGDLSYFKRCVRCQTIYEHLSAKMDDSGEPDEFCDEELNCGHTYEKRWEEPPPEHIAALAFWLPGDPLPSKSQG